MRSRLPAALRQAGLGAGGPRAILGFAGLAAGRALALVIMAEAVADGIASAVAHTDAWQQYILVGLLGALLRGAIAWGTRTFATRSALESKEALRRDLAGRLLEDGVPSIGSATVLGTHGLDELDNYYRTVLPSITSAAVIPIMIGARLLVADWLSAVIVAVTIVLVPLFMALIGIHTNERVSAASAALARLSDHLVELARGLPVLVGLGRAEEQTAALTTISDDYRAKTMKTLRVAFVSSLALELISTISVALVAVSIGLRLVNGDLTLGIGLVVLILAPECFTPFRDLGASFHASQDGLGALSRVRAIIDAPARRSVAVRSGEWSVSDLTVRFTDRMTDAISGVTFAIPRGEVTALQGVSGSGKSTVLDILAGQLRGGDDVEITGHLGGIGEAAVAWLPQHPRFVAESVRAELELYAEDSSAATRLRMETLLVDLGLTGIAASSPDDLSSGEARRVALARTFLRVDAGATLVLLDEPTAHLDERIAGVVRQMIAALSGRTTVVLASHDSDVNALATNVVHIGGTSELRRAASATLSEPFTTPSAEVFASGTSKSSFRFSSGRLLWEFLRPAMGRYVGAAALGTLAVLFAISMTTVSGWLIVKASEHPSIMYLSVAIVGVRFFGIGRSALHYAERLVTHDAVLQSIAVLRGRMWRAFVSRGAASRKMLGGASVLDHLVGAADHVRDLAPRAIIPAAVALLTSGTVIIAVATLDSDALPIIAACIAICLIVAPAATLAADRAAAQGTQRLQSRVLQRFAAMLAAAPDLRANGVAARVRQDLAADDRAAGRESRRGSGALGLGSAIIVFTCCLAAVLTFTISGPQVSAGVLPIELVAVLAFLPLTLVDSLLGSTEAIQQWPALAFQLARIGEVLATHSVPTITGSRELDEVRRLELRELAARWPGSPHATIAGVNIDANRGDWVVVSGPSGSGKSTLLSVVLGYLAPEDGTYSINDTDTRVMGGASLRKRIAWAPQDGYLFDSSLRGNLLISRSRDDAPSEAEMRSVLTRVGLGDLIDGLSDGLDTAVGAGGSHLSGGQCQRVVVARTLLTRADVVLLDEPTAHLDAAAADELMTDLRLALADKVVIMVTHHADERRAYDLSVVLAADGALTSNLATARG